MISLAARITPALEPLYAWATDCQSNEGYKNTKGICRQSSIEVENYDKDYLYVSLDNGRVRKYAGTAPLQTLTRPAPFTICA